MTLVDEIIQVSGAQLHETSSVHWGVFTTPGLVQSLRCLRGQPPRRPVGGGRAGTTSGLIREQLASA